MTLLEIIHQEIFFCVMQLAYLSDRRVRCAEPSPECVDGDLLIRLVARLLLPEDVLLHAARAAAVLVAVVSGVFLR